MSASTQPGLTHKLEIAHVLFMDIVAYSRMPMEEQEQVQRCLQEAVRRTDEFIRAQSADQLISLPTGDGMALVFFGDAEAPVRCALELSKVLRAEPVVQVRMGIHSGPVYRVADINANRNVAGGGINIAQRVMDCGDGGHILVSQAVADVLGQLSAWKPALHDLGETEVKHGVKVHVHNLYTDEAGNREIPRKLQGKAPWKRRPYRRALVATTVLAMVLLTVGVVLRSFKGQLKASGMALKERQLTHNPSENTVLGAAISPDGRYVAYADTTALRLRQVDTGEVHEVPLPDEVQTHLRDVSWFPDGERLIVQTAEEKEGNIIWETSVFGGAPRKLRINAGSAVVSPQGTLIAFISGDGHEIWVMGPHGENPKRILANETGQYWDLAWSPTGQRLAYTKPSKTGSVEESIETVSLESGPSSVVITDYRVRVDCGLLWLRDGRLVFFMNNPQQTGSNIWGIMIDEQTGRPSEKAVRITNWGDQWAWSPSASKDNNRLVVIRPHARGDAYVAELRENGTRLNLPQRLTWSVTWEFPESWTLDSRSVLIRSDRTGKDQIFRQEIGHEAAEPLMLGPDEQREAEFSPDGAWLLHFAGHYRGDAPPEAQHLMRFPTSGGSSEQVFEFPWRSYHTVDFHCPPRPPGSCVVNRWQQDQLVFYALDPIHGQGKELGRTRLGQTEDFDWSISPDGTHIAIKSGDQLPEQIRIVDLQSSTEHNVQLPRGWYIKSLRYAADGRALFAAIRANEHLIVRIELDGKSRVLLNRGRNQPLYSVRPSPDGHYLAFGETTRENNAWLLENF